MKKLLLTIFALYSISQIHAIDLLQYNIFKINSKQKTNFNLREACNNNHNPKDLTELIDDYEIPSLIESLISNSVYIYEFIKQYEEINVYSTEKLKVSIHPDYFNPEFEISIELILKK